MDFHFKNHLIIGFAGKRAHQHLNIIPEKLKSLFEAINNKLKDCEMHFFTGLADGADQLAALAFSDFFKNEIEHKNKFLGAVIPFNTADYLHTIKDKDTYQELFDQCNQVLELDGKFGKGPGSQQLMDKAFQQQGSTLSRMADLLIAVAPKSDHGKPGGTIQTIMSVLSLKKPVIFFNLDDQKFYLYENIEEWFGGKKEMGPIEICNLLFDSGYAKVTQTWDDTTTDNIIFRSRKRAWILFERIFKGKKRTASQPEKQTYNELHKRLWEIQDKLDAKAVDFQYQYRGGFILNYLLAIIAIFLAVISLIIDGEKRFIPEHISSWLLVGVGLLKMAILSTLLINTKEINKNEYNRKAIDYRYAAERLRVNVYMSILGVLRSPFPSLGNHSKKHFARYRGEAIYQEAMSGPLCIKFSHIVEKQQLLNFLKVLKEEWIGEQKKYHDRESGRMEKMDQRLERIPELLSKVILIIVGIDLAAGFFVEIIGIPISPSLRTLCDILFPVLLGMAAFIPAIITTLNSIQFQSEAHRLYVRSNLMLDELKNQDKEIIRVISEIAENEDGSNFFPVLNIMDNAANILTDEVAEWSLIYEKRVYDQ